MILEYNLPDLIKIGDFLCFMNRSDRALPCLWERALFDLFGNSLAKIFLKGDTLLLLTERCDHGAVEAINASSFLCVRFRLN